MVNFTSAIDLHPYAFMYRRPQVSCDWLMVAMLSSDWSVSPGAVPRAAVHRPVHAVGVAGDRRHDGHHWSHPLRGAQGVPVLQGLR